MLAKNHNILQNEYVEEQKSLPQSQRKRVKMIQSKPVMVQNRSQQNDDIPDILDDDIQQIDDSNYQMEDE